MVRKIKTKNIEFITTVPPLVDIAPPVPASQMIPNGLICLVMIF